MFLETIGNPRLDVHDIAAIADVAHAKGVPVIVDNTFAPLLAQPIEHGADIVIHSATKWIGGHGTAIGGVVVDGGNVRLGRVARGSRRTSSTPTRATTASATRRRFGPLAFILKLRVQGLRDIGAALSPFNAFLFLQGLETLPLRIDAPQRERAGGRPLAGDAARVDLGQLPGPRVASVARARPSSTSRAASAAS